jgi:hypothetical protein
MKEHRKKRKGIDLAPTRELPNGAGRATSYVEFYKAEE